jgi:AcrR family transcriptional regulator
MQPLAEIEEARMVEQTRRLRADAVDNEKRLLDAAALVFAAGGESTLKAVAKAAGVGIGTLYRRFPTREHLVEAVYRNESARLCASATDLLGEQSAVDALRDWMGRFVEYISTKNGMADSLHAVLSADDGLRLHTRAMLAEAIATMMQAGVAQGTIRADLDPQDVMMSLGGITLITAHEGQRELADRLIDILVDGLRIR